LEGETNSKNNIDIECIFANKKKKKEEAIEIHSRLLEDSIINQKNIVKYIPLITYFTGIGGIPITKEFRFFVSFGKILYGAYY
jgi:hypothetical protein